MTLSREEKLARLRLWRTPKVGPATFHDLIANFGSAETVLAELPGHVRSKGRAAPKIPNRQEAVAEIEALHAMGGRFLFADTPEFPVALSHIADAPPLLACLGRVELLQRPCIAIVGSRNASLAGKHMTAQFAETLGAEGFVIVSGLAKGIDAAAHRAALKTGTIAVVAGGLDVIYPRENTDLHHVLATDGLIISEQRLGMPTSARLFPLRNRLVSGLSLGTVVVEANARSGSLITARLAGEQGREVFAVPGSPLEGRSEGTNQLLKQGATLVTKGDDILDVLASTPLDIFSSAVPKDDSTPLFGPPEPQASPTQAASKDLNDLILENLTLDPIPIDALALECKVSAAAIQAALADLELGGLILRHVGGQVSKAP